jgi:hypothetical protein
MEVDTLRQAWRHEDKHGDMETLNGKRKTRRFSLIRLPLTHRENGSYPFANGLNGLAHLCLNYVL